MDQTLTIVLPVHNCERQLRSSLQDVLDLIPTISRPVEIVIVDDGSTDDTYEAAFELARLYPQLTLLRQPVRQGIGAALDLVRNRLAVEMVLVHDGVSAIDASQLQEALQPMRQPETAIDRAGSATESTGSRRFAAVRALHDRMEQVHRSSASFRWIQLDRPLVPRRRTSSATHSVSPSGTLPLGFPVQLANLPVGIDSPSQT